MVKIFFLLVFILPGWALAQPLPNPLSLAEALKVARENQPSFQNSLLDRRIAQQATRQLRARWYPQLSGSLDFRYNPILQTNLLPFNLTNPGAATGSNSNDVSVPVKFGKKWNGTAGITLQQVLFDGTLSPALSASSLSEEASLTAQTKADIDLNIAVSKAYYATLIAQAQVHFAGRDLSRNQVLAKDLTEKETVGKALPTDVTRAKINVNTARIALQSAQQNLNVAHTNLYTQLGRSEAPAANLTLSDSLFGLLPQTASAPISYLEAAPEARTEYRTEQLQQQISLLNVKQDRRRFLPTVSLVGYLASQGFANNLGDLGSFNQRWYGYSYIALQAAIPLWDGGDRQARLEQSRLKSKKSDNNLATLAASFRSEQATAEAQVRQTTDALALQRESLALAEANARLAQARYSEGRALYQEAFEAQTVLTQAQTQVLQAAYNQLLAGLELRRALGAFGPESR